MSKSGAGSSKPLKIRFNPPSGYPLGVNPTFRFCASILIPIMKLVARYDYREGVKIPKSGPVIVVSNHVLALLTWTSPKVSWKVSSF